MRYFGSVNWVIIASGDGLLPILCQAISWNNAQFWFYAMQYYIHKKLETHKCIFNTIVTDALVLKHQAISIHILNKISLY